MRLKCEICGAEIERKGPGCERGASRGTKERTSADPAGICGATLEQSENGGANTQPPAGAVTGQRVFDATRQNGGGSRRTPGCKPKYCDVCRAERRRASQRKTYHKKEEQRKAQEAMHKLAPARSLSMNELLRELDQFNAKRRQMGLAPVSYGRYVAFRDKYIKEI